MGFFNGIQQVDIGDGANVDLTDVESKITNNTQKINENTNKINEIISNKTTQKIVEKMINKESVNIVCYGDDITYGAISNTEKTVNPYPETLQKLLRDYYKYDNITVINEGHIGKQSDELATDEYINYVKRHNPDLVIIMIGTNDKIGIGGAIKLISEYMNCLKTIYEELKSYEIMLMTIAPHHLRGTNATQRINGGIYSNAIKNFALINSIEVFDINRFIENYYKYDVQKRLFAQPNHIYFTDEMYMNIAKCVYINKFSPLNSIVKDDVKFDCIHGIFRLKVDSAIMFTDGANGNDEKYCFKVPCDITMDVFIDEKEKNMYVDVVKSSTGATTEIYVDDVKVGVVNFYDKNVCTMKEVFICRLPYGYHKIKFTPITNSEGGNTTEFSSIKFYNNIKDINKNMTNRLITTDTGAVKSMNIKKSTKIDTTKKHHRIFVASTMRSGIGFGTVTKSDGECPLSLLVFGESNVLFGITKPPTLSTILATVPSIPRVIDEVYDDIIDIIETDKIRIYANETLVYETDDKSILGNGDLYLVNYKELATDINMKVYLKNVVSYDEVLGVGKYNELDSYYSYRDKKVKTYIEGVWV